MLAWVGSCPRAVKRNRPTNAEPSDRNLTHRRRRKVRTLSGQGVFPGDVSERVAPHITPMDYFHYDAPAEVFAGRGRRGQRHAMTYRRFPTGAEAIQHVIEFQDAEMLAGTVVEVGADDIRDLYDSSDYPLPRKRAH
jgi:hypothetical protein